MVQGQGDRGGLLACRTHAAPHYRQAFVVEEDSDVHGPAGVCLPQGGVTDERHFAGLVWVHIAWVASEGAFCWAFIRRVRRLRGVGGAEAVSVVPHEVGQLGGRALGGFHNYGGRGLEGGDSAWGLRIQGGWGGTRPIVLRGLRCWTIPERGPRDSLVGSRRGLSRGALATGAGPPRVAGITPFRGLFARRAPHCQGIRILGAL